MYKPIQGRRSAGGCAYELLFVPAALFAILPAW